MNFRPVDTTEIMTMHEVADWLQVCYSTIYRLAHRGKLPCFRVGTDWRFMRSELERWMRESEVQSQVQTPPRPRT